MIRWLFRQKIRAEKGLCVMPLINFGLLCLSASDRIQRAIPLSTTAIVALLFPSVLVAIWIVGYALTTPRMQAAEDEAIGDLIAWRRQLNEIARREQ